jgi:DNA-binding CsgD family transcriptional regulator
MYLDVLSSSLKEIISPLARNLVVSERNLTASEVRVADLIMLGKSSKEIADMLNISIRTVETHRHNLRTKLGLEKTKRNLQSYLRHRSNP